MANGGKIMFDVGFNTDASGLQKALQELKSIQTLEPLDIVSLEGIDTVKIKLDDAKKAANELGIAFESSFNKDIGVLNLSKFEEKIKSIGDGTLRGLQQRLAGAGEVGSSAFRKIYTEILTTNTYVKETDKLISNIATTLGNTLKWNLSSGAINKMTGSIQEAWGFTKSLDSSLNNIQIVTNKSSEEMSKFAIQANNAARSLKTTTTAYTDAALTFYQQGLSDEDVAARAETSLKVSNVTGLSGDQSAEYVTAVLNGYKVAAAEAEHAMDKLAAVGAHTASSLAELSEAMAKVASSANAMGVSEDQLAATLSTVISVTRQDASTVGTAFKTIYARISDIKAGSEEAEISLGNYTKKMAEMGFSVLDSAGNMRDLGEVMEEIGGKWETLTKEQQISLAQTMAGTRQYNNLIALFDNWTQYEDALNVSMKANGTLQQQQEIYAESLSAKLNELTAAKEKLYMSFVDSDSMKGMIEALTGVTNLFSNFIEGIGGGGTALLQLGAIALRVFGKQISASIQTVMKNIAGMKQSIENSAAKMRMITDVKQGSTSETIAKITAQYEKIDAVINTLDADQQNMLLNMLAQESEIIEQKTAWEADTKAALEYIKTVTDGQLDIESKMFKTDDKGKKQITGEGMSAEETAQFNRAFNKKEKQFVGDSTVLNEQLSTLKEISKIEKEIDTITKNGSKNVKKLSASDKARLAELQKQKAELKEVELSYEEMQAVIKRINDEDLKLIDDETTKAQIKSITNELEVALKRCGDNATAAIDEDIKRLAAELEAVMLAADKKLADKKADVQNQTSTKSGQRGANLQSQSKNAEEAVDKSTSDAEMQAKIQNFTNLTSAIMGVASAIMALQNIGSIWRDDDLSTGQKILQTVMAVGGAIMSLIPMYSMLITATAAKAAANKAETATTAAKNTQLTAEIGLKTTLLGLNPALLAGTLLVTAAVVAFGFAIGGATKKISEEEKAFNKATEASKSASEQLDTVRSQYENLKNTIEDSVKAEESINKLTKNTQEWRDAIFEANQRMLELMRNYPELAAAIESTPDGLLTLNTDSEAYQNYLDKQNSQYEYSKALSVNKSVDLANAAYDKQVAETEIKYLDIDKIISQGKTQYDPQAYKKNMPEYEAFKDFEEFVNANRNDYEAIKAEYQKLPQLYDKKQNPDGSYTKTPMAAYASVSKEDKLAVAALLAKNNGNAYDENTNRQDLNTLEGIEKLNLDPDVITALNGDLNSTDSILSQLTNSFIDTQAALEGFRETIKTINFKDQDQYSEEEQGLTRSYIAGQAVDENSKYYQMAMKELGLENGWVKENGSEHMDTKTDTIDSDDEAQWYLEKVLGYDKALAQTATYDSETKRINYGDDMSMAVGGLEGEDIVKAYAEKLATESDTIVEETYNAISSAIENGGQGEYKDVIMNAMTAMVTGDLTDIKQSDIDTLLENQDAIFDPANEEMLQTLANLVGIEDVEVFKQQLMDIIAKRAETSDGELLTQSRDAFKGKAQGLSENLGNLQENSRYQTKEQIMDSSEYDDLQANSEKIKELYPDLSKDIEILNETQKIGSEEWLASLEKVKETMAAIAEDEDGIFTAEDAEKAGLTVDKLTEAYNQGIISQETYEQKLQGTIDAELKAIEVSQEEFDSYVDGLKSVSKNLEKDDVMAKKVAMDNLKLEKTIETLSKDFDEYGDIIKSGDKNNIKYAQGINKIRSSAEKMLGTEISDDFIADHLEEIEKLANGDLTVFDELQKAATQDLIMEIATEIDDPALQETFAEMNNIIANADIENLEVGASLESTEFGNALADLVNSSNLTVEEMQKIFDSFGFEPSVEWEKVDANTVNLAQTHAYIKGADGTYQEIQDQAQLETQETVWIPKINSSSTVYKGSPKNTISPKSSGGKGGGGGGGSKKEKDPDKMDKLDDEIDRYHDINIQIALLETQYDRLGKAQDKLLGKDLINNLNQQLKILEKQIDAYKTKITLEKQEAAELQGDLGAKGVKFNDDGTIANYADVLKAKEDYVNSLIEKYNGMSAEEQESYKEVVEKAKEDYEKFKENIDRYDTIITEEIPGLEDQIQDAVDQQIEINIKKFTMGIEIRLEMKEAEQDWNKFKRKIIDGMKDDNIFGQGLESLENYRDYFDLGGGQGGTVDALTKQVNDTMAEIQKMQAGEVSEIFGNDMAKAMETLTTYNSELMTQLEDMEDLVESIEQGLLDTMDEVKEKMDAQVEAYEYVNDLLESDMELVQMLYGEDSYEALGNYYAQKHENYKQALDFDKQEVSFWQQEMDAAKASGNEEAYQKALENYREGVKKLNEDVKASVQNIIDSYSNTINQIFDKLDKKMSSKAGGMDSLREEWELINTNADRYLDTINSTYEVQKLQNKYKTSINAAESTKVQQKLNALMEEEIGMLEKKDKLSQYDIDRANMKYDIALKQIALEEAQQNKSSMRMKRDAQGNYSYVYAGDEDDISSKTQELADAQNQLYNLDKEQYRQNMDDIVSYTAEMQEKIKELYEDPTMDPAVREEREKTIREQYGELINNIIADNESIRANLHESTFDSLSMLYETDADNFRTMTGLENDDWSNMTDDMLNNIQTKMIPTWDGSVQHMIDTFIADGGIGPTIDQVFKDADEALKNYESSLSEVEAAAGISFDAIKNGTDAASESAKELIGDNKEIMDQCKEQIEEYKNLIAQVKDLAAAYDGVRDAAIRAANAAHTLAEEINNQSVSAADDPTIGPNMPSPSSPSGPTVDPNGPGGNPTNPASGDGSGDGVLNVGDEVTYTGGKYYADSYGGGKSGERGPGKKVKVTIIKDDGRPYPIHVESSDSAYGWLKKEQLSGFKSGGFTGSWQGGVDRDDGRLALLHQKELVLNADDTDNFLKAMQDLRKAQNEIKTVSSSGVISAMFNSISDAITAKMQNLQSAQADMLNAKGPAGGGLTGTIQNITINADFPEVSDANEIRKAFDQIIGMASQKASNKSR